MLVLTYDEHGGYYDHVPPPPAIPPDAIPPPGSITG
jgi:phospholipase C